MRSEYLSLVAVILFAAGAWFFRQKVAPGIAVILVPAFILYGFGALLRFRRDRKFWRRGIAQRQVYKFDLAASLVTGKIGPIAGEGPGIILWSFKTDRPMFRLYWPVSFKTVWADADGGTLEQMTEDEMEREAGDGGEYRTGLATPATGRWNVCLHFKCKSRNRDWLRVFVIVRVGGVRKNVATSN